MPLSGNAIDNNALAAMARRAGPAVTAAIHQASLKTGVNFAYLMEKADTESSFDADAHARGSSARGLYQFIDRTWLQMINRYGDKYGLGHYADQIDEQGKVSSPAAKKEILALRDDPKISALMAGEFAVENRQSLINSGIKSRDIGATELYLAHFLGAGSASEFIKTMQKDPLIPAADIFPKAAKANPHIFYTKTRRARSVGEIYAIFDRKFDDIPGAVGKPAKTQENPQIAAGKSAATHYARNSILRTLPGAAQQKMDAMALNMLADDGAGENVQPTDFFNSLRHRGVPEIRMERTLTGNTATLMPLMRDMDRAVSAHKIYHDAARHTHHKDPMPAKDSAAQIHVNAEPEITKKSGWVNYAQLNS